MSSMNESSLPDAALAELLTLTVEVDGNGTIRYRNHLGQKHRVHGPAVVHTDGEQWWFLHDVHHRIDGPAVICDDGSKEWWIHGRRLTEESYSTFVCLMTHWQNSLPSLRK